MVAYQSYDITNTEDCNYKKKSNHILTFIAQILPNMGFVDATMKINESHLALYLPYYEKKFTKELLYQDFSGPFKNLPRMSE